MAISVIPFDENIFFTYEHKKIENKDQNKLQSQNLKEEIELLVHHRIKILNQYCNSIETHAKDIQPEVLNIYVP